MDIAREPGCRYQPMRYVRVTASGFIDRFKDCFGVSRERRWRFTSPTGE